MTDVNFENILVSDNMLLYIPQYWTHHVFTETPSISYNLWFKNKSDTSQLDELFFENKVNITFFFS
jgi:hypothetical protein